MQSWRNLLLIVLLGAIVLATLPPHPQSVQAQPVVGSCADPSAPFYFTGDDFIVVRNLSFSGVVREREPKEPPFVGVMRLYLAGQLLHEVSGGPGSHLTLAITQATVTGLAPNGYSLSVGGENMASVTPANDNYPSYFYVGTTIGGTVFEDYSLSLPQTINSVCVNIPPGRSLTIANKLFRPSGLSLPSIGNAGRLIVRDSVFAERDSVFDGPFSIPEMSSGEFIFTENLFEREVSLSGRSRITLSKNQFLKPLLFQGPIWAARGAPPVIEDNSFVGQYALVYDSEALPPEPLAIGANYYGDANGPDLGGSWVYDGIHAIEHRAIQRRNEILRMRGAEVALSPTAPVHPITRFFTLAPHLTSGPYFAHDRRAFPTFTLNGVQITQNTLQHNTTHVTIGGVLRQQRESLLTVDLTVDDRDVTGVELYVRLDGQIIQPVVAPRQLHRDSNLYGSLEVHQRGRSTFNFILPPVSTRQPRIEIVLDTSNVSGYRTDRGGVKEIYSFAPVFREGCQRTFNIAILPVAIERRGYPTGAPDGVAMQQSLLNLLPAMFPILPEELNIQVLPTYTNRGYFLPAPVVMQQLIFKAGTYRLLRQVTGNMADDEVLDIIVVVVKPGALNTLWYQVDGANHWSNRRVLLVVEDQPEAAIHELGHAFGLYRGKEQYDMYPDFGIRLAGMSAFVPDARLSLGAHAADIEANRFRHFPQKLANDNVTTWYDVMGAERKMVWPIPSTQREFTQGLFYDRCGGAIRPADNHVTLSHVAPRATPARTLAIWGEVQYAGTLDTNWMPQLRIAPGSLEMIEITPIANGRLVGEHACTLAIDPDCGSGYNFADLYAEFFDQAGNVIHTELVYIRNRDLTDEPQQRDTFFVTISGIPTEATRAVFWNRIAVNPDEMRLTELELDPVGNVELQATMEGAGMQLNWTRERLPRHELLLISQDQGRSWRTFGFVSGGSARVPAFGHRPGDQPALAVLASNGLGASLSTAVPLSQHNFAPGVRILSPHPEDQASPETIWTLAAQAHDAEDGLITTGIWRSSLQGELGTGRTLTTTLQAGTHTLSYQVRDSQGASSIAQVQVHVTSTPPAALPLAPTALSLNPAYRGDASATQLELRAAISYTARLEIRNQGYPLSGMLQVRLNAAGTDHPRLLREQALTLAPFDLEVVTFPLGPFDAAQSHQLEARFIADAAPESGRDTWTRWNLTTSAAAPGTTTKVWLPQVVRQ